ncbi:alpha/beta hydrolase [Mangrovimicrobium sediminis]|nr:alpha/beta fold hydrolase [Haliea sp. SAOS-164]
MPNIECCGRRLRGGCLAALALLAALLAGCTTVHIDEAMMLQDRRQELLYRVALHGPATSAQLAQEAAYPLADVERELAQLARDEYVQQRGDRWDVGPAYPPGGLEYTEAVRGFDAEALRQRQPGHRFVLYRLDPPALQVAAFLAEDPDTTLLLFGGNGFHLIPDVTESEKLLAPGRNLFAMDYPGMGGSAGETRIEELRAAAQRFFEHVTGLDAVRGTRIVVYGFSIGGFVASEIAASYPVDGLILDSTAPDIQAWVDANVPWYARALVDVDIAPPLRTVSNTRQLATIACPVLFLVGGRDRVTPPRFGRELAQSALAAPWTDVVELAQAEHGGSSDDPRFAAVVDGFIARLAAAETARR